MCMCYISGKSSLGRRMRRLLELILKKWASIRGIGLNRLRIGPYDEFGISH